MPNYNRVILAGNLTRDPQMKYLPSQTACTEFGLAINRRFKTQGGEDREEVCFVDCTTFGGTAENVNKYFTKGKPILVEGRLKYDSWDDKNGGGKRSKLTVVVDQFQFIESKGGGGGNDEPQQEPARQQRPLGTRPPSTASVGKQEMPPSEDTFALEDIPFRSPTA